MPRSKPMGTQNEILGFICFLSAVIFAYFAIHDIFTYGLEFGMDYLQTSLLLGITAQMIKNGFDGTPS